MIHTLCEHGACLKCAEENEVTELRRKFAIAVEALELTIDTLEMYQHKRGHSEIDVRFIGKRLETARAALEKINGDHR